MFNRKGLALIVALIALVTLAVSEVAAGPIQTIPAGFRLGGVFRVTAAKDTLLFTETTPTGYAVAKNFGKKAVVKPTPGVGTLTMPSIRSDGFIAAGKKPFRFRAWFAGSMSTGTVHVPVDTISTTSSDLKYPCRTQITAALDSLRIQPASGDTVWVFVLLRD